MRLVALHIFKSSGSRLMRLNRAHSATPPPKRPLASTPEATPSSAAPEPASRIEPISKRPRKASRRVSPMRPGSGSMRASTSAGPHARRGRSVRHAKPTKSSKRRTSPAHESRRTLPQPDDPVHDDAWIAATYQVEPLKQSLITNPKSTISNWCSNQGKPRLEYAHEVVLIHGQLGSRATINLGPEPPVIGIGDATGKREAERLAALHAVHQLAAVKAFDRPKPVKPEPGPTTATLSSGEQITYERARQFMDYYCRRYDFGKPDVVYAESRGAGKTTGWEAVMHVGGRRIGIGTGPNKKSAQTQCYIDVTQYLESCDTELWKAFTAASSKGKDLGLAPRVLMEIDERLEDDIRDIAYDVRKSTLYQNRPSSTTSVATVEAPSNASARFRTPASLQHLIEKSRRLLEKRKSYLADPKMEKMRQTRSALPVYTRAADLISHVRAHEVTVCVAATGSGKTTQIPQLILDDFIERGEGAKCNIICTQPRRIAAISVAHRVATERGESVGRGSVGYQVRFEAAFPEENGSITFCTTGVFLRRMQSALQQTGFSRGVSMDDVTHILVDEVHERDVDTDLLLVVLKRLLSDRKAKEKPLKVILMSATANASLFEQYFSDERGRPAGVIDIPGRSFPVIKHYMDDFLPELARDPANATIFSDQSVTKYIEQELPPSVVQQLGSRRHIQVAEEDQLKDGDLDLPYPLIALTTAHVMKKTKDGHVLVFLPGWEEIQSVQRLLTDGTLHLGLDFNDTAKFSIHVLHSSIPIAEQQVIFDPPPVGVRRVILSTNIAETSVTIPDIVYVVDSGKIKEQRYDPQRHMSSLVSAWVGTSNLNQRAGRAGRHRAGEYYGILSHRRVAQLPPNQLVEMQRTDLTNVVMHVKALDFPGMAVEDVLAATIEPPSAARISVAMEDLRLVGALDEGQNLTSLGRVLLQLPIEVGIGRMVLFGSFFRCLDQALSLAAILTNRDPFVTPVVVKQQAQAVKDGWTPIEYRSDILAVLRAFNEWAEKQTRGRYVEANRFASDNFLSKPTLLQMLNVKRHLAHSLYQSGVFNVSAAGRAEVYSRGKEVIIPPELNKNGDSLPLLVALIASASQPNFAIRTSQHVYRTQRDKNVLVHPSSVNHRKREIVNSPEGGIVEKQIIAFQEKRQNISVAGATSEKAPMYLMGTTRLDPMTYVLFGAYEIKVTDRGLECDDWLPIVGNVYALDDLSRLKLMIEGCMLRVFEGLLVHRQRRPRRFAPVTPRDEEESGDEEEGKDTTPKPLSEKEVKELDYLTKDIVTILNQFGEAFVSAQSRISSRPGTPVGSPLNVSIRLPRSGASTPWGAGSRSAYNSRPSTPSALARELRS